ncbi:YihY/virulence factor BrkB family protein [Spirosoma oryzicola]|uniref:YihY/virulence factor BrkB family protein n=1 Tax=Spirosoma oryzicola TaxID=2898794 RepID=UPI001E5281C2|nr:YihY/virulence factor BrkB family protein [Spirosoma oryzicola]UHG92336.1 YihY/virulence factor BrkB family protein [Spirosoma oryzicola]
MKKAISAFQLLKQAFDTLRANDPIRMAGATAFFAFFALPPIVIILSSVFSQLFNKRYQYISGALIEELAELFGHKSASQLEDISQRLQQPKPDPLLTILGFVLLFVASTTLFAILKNSLNQLWNIKSKPGRNVLYTLVDKLVALAIIIGSGLLLSLSVAVEQLMTVTGNSLSLSSLSYYNELTGLGHYSVSILIRVVWFASLLKFLPDIRIPWQSVWLGALFTSVLFKAGESVLNRLLINSPVASMYGQSGAIILVLLFIFYASLIFYYGAAFTRRYSEWTHQEVTPNSRAISFTITEEDPSSTTADK